MEYSSTEMADSAMSAGTMAGASVPLAVLFILVLLLLPLLIQQITRWVAKFKPTYKMAFSAMIVAFLGMVVANTLLGMLVGLVARLQNIELRPDAAQTPQMMFLSLLIAIAINTTSYQHFLRDPATGARISKFTAAKIYAGLLFIIALLVLPLLLGADPLPQPE